MSGLRTAYASDARRQQQEYRQHKFVFRNARIIRTPNALVQLIESAANDTINPTPTESIYIADISLKETQKRYPSLCPAMMPAIAVVKAGSRMLAVLPVNETCN
jgi:hypothetical protein